LGEKGQGCITIDAPSKSGDPGKPSIGKIDFFSLSPGGEERVGVRGENISSY
jgi:hypothetical protein